MMIDPAFEDHLAQLALQAKIWLGIGCACSVLLITVALSSERGFAAWRGPRLNITSALLRLRALHRGESAIASLEFLMVLVPFLAILLAVWQLAFMANAQIHVGYAAYTAARSAAVMIPADLEREAEYLLSKQGSQGAEKWKRIRRAALPGLIPISPGDGVEGAEVVLVARRGGKLDRVNEPEAGATQSRVGLLGAHYGLDGVFSGTRFGRAEAKDVYAQTVTEVLIDDKNHTVSQSLRGKNTVKVTVKYLFWLHVPLAGRLIEAAVENKLTDINPFPSLMLEETVHMKLWNRQRTIEPSC